MADEITTPEQFDALFADEQWSDVMIRDAGGRPWIVWEDQDGDVHATSSRWEDDGDRDVTCEPLSAIAYPAVLYRSDTETDMTLPITGSPKMLREALCVAQGALAGADGDRSRHEYALRLQGLIDALDVVRPLGPDGTHGNRHTVACGCEDIQPTVLSSQEEWATLIQAERDRQRAKGYDEAHDDEHGIEHLLNWAIDYARRGEAVKSSALVLAALDWLKRHQPTVPPTREAVESAELIAEAKALVESWDRKGSWTADSPVGMVDRLADALARTQPTALPTREDVANIALAYSGETITDSPYQRKRWLDIADAILTLLPGRSEAEVKAEALREEAERIRASSRVHSHDLAFTEVRWRANQHADALDVRADQIAEEAGRG